MHCVAWGHFSDRVHKYKIVIKKTIKSGTLRLKGGSNNLENDY